MEKENLQFDYTRVEKAKKVVDLSPNTIRKFAKLGHIHLFKCGKVAFFSRRELEAFIQKQVA